VLKSRTVLVYGLIWMISFILRDILPGYPFGIFLGIAALLALLDATRKYGIAAQLGLVAFLLILSAFSRSWFVGDSISLILILAGTLAGLISCLTLLVAQRIVRRSAALLSFFIVWIGVESLVLSFAPFANGFILGNTIQGVPNWVQWYSFTGVIGGSAWILLVNMMFYMSLFRDEAILNGAVRWRVVPWTLLLIALPVLGSLYFLTSFDNGPEQQRSPFEIHLSLYDQWTPLLASENPANNYNSTYAMYGEFVGRTGLWLSILVFIWLLVKKISTKWT